MKLGAGGRSTTSLTTSFDIALTSRKPNQLTISRLWLLASAVLSDYRDRERLKSALRMSAKMFDHPKLRAAVLDVLASSYSECVRE